MRNMRKETVSMLDHLRQDLLRQWSRELGVPARKWRHSLRRDFEEAFGKLAAALVSKEEGVEVAGWDTSPGYLCLQVAAGTRISLRFLDGPPREIWVEEV